MLGLLKAVTLHSGLVFASAFHMHGLGPLPLQVSDDIGVDLQAFSTAVTAGAAPAPAATAPSLPGAAEVPNIPIDGMLDTGGATPDTNVPDLPADASNVSPGSGSDIPAF